MNLRFSQHLKKIKGNSEEIGFGTRDTGQTERLLNKDGSFNVIRKGLPLREQFAFYHYLVTIKWPKFFVVVLSGFIAINLIFTSIYMMLGHDSLNGLEATNSFEYFIEVFSFSAQSFTTVGYGRINPHGMWPDFISSVESLIGLLAFAIATGLLYGRFARPKARFLFSDIMVMAPFKGGRGLMYRVANKLNHQITELDAMVTFSIMQEVNGAPMRRFYTLPLEISKVNYFPTSWTINHIVDEKSPIRYLTAEDFESGDAEFFIMMKGFDENFSQNIYVRNSYKFDEVKWGYKFKSMLGEPENGNAVLNMDMISALEVAELPVNVEVST